MDVWTNNLHIASRPYHPRGVIKQMQDACRAASNCESESDGSNFKGFNPAQRLVAIDEVQRRSVAYP
jgi:hypothetical protein